MPNYPKFSKPKLENLAISAMTQKIKNILIEIELSIFDFFAIWENFQSALHPLEFDLLKSFVAKMPQEI